MVYRILVGSYSDEIVTLAFDPDARTLEATSALKVGHHPSWLTAYPTHPSLVRTGLEQSDGRILTIEYDESGKGTILSDVPSGGQDPCCLLALEDEILVANVRICVHFSRLLFKMCPVFLGNHWHTPTRPQERATCIHTEHHPITRHRPERRAPGRLAPTPSARAYGKRGVARRRSRRRQCTPPAEDHKWLLGAARPCRLRGGWRPPPCRTLRCVRGPILIILYATYVHL